MKWLALSVAKLTVDDTTITVRDMLALQDPPTAVLTTETNAMIGTLQAIRQSGLSYPRDLSVIGFDDNSWSGVMDPPLTMIAQPMAQLGEVAAARLMEMISDSAGPLRTDMLRTEFKERRSTAPPAQGRVAQ